MGITFSHRYLSVKVGLFPLLYHCSYRGLEDKNFEPVLQCDEKISFCGGL
jgi:hypothetical protein